MRGRAQAVIVTAVCVLLSVKFPPLSYIAGAAVGLVSLRRGHADGLMIIGGAAIIAALLDLYARGTVLPAILMVLTILLPIWLLALVLRISSSQGFTLGVAGGIGLLGITLLHLLMDSPLESWRGMIEESLRPVLEQVLEKSGMVVTEELVEQVAMMMFSLVPAATVLSAVLAVLLARWWQSLLYNPGGFATEFRKMRLPRWAASVTLGLFLFFLVGSGESRLLGLEMLLVAEALYLLQALAVVHAIIAGLGASVAWLVFVYLAIFLWPHALLLLGTAGFADTWLDFRRRMGVN